jgi:hypothetical protein
MTKHQEIERLALKLMTRFGLIDKGWKFAWNKRARAYGVCKYRVQRIELSSVLIPHLKMEDIRATILHEIAHALTPGHGHDRVWRDVCIRIGGTGLVRSQHEGTPVVGKYGLFFGDELIRTYLREPSEATKAKVKWMYVPSIGMAETVGRLEIRLLSQEDRK